ncbi:Duplicated homeodomain-like superfamily protein [Perilla frutescens var. hirtella]|uniref:Duplicated homeodomain-like superfamily protein n=1 Tax=Perilla frutescens var. hirtella TaxID=608512 RepID=A0AAD4J4S3_PERFH|nr:Duplicated homeodomain-like superfamily protein [Perilla frutescens var. hirtella]
METLCPTSVVSKSNSSSSWVIQQYQQRQKTGWTKEENKRFESALAIFDEKTPNRWFKVAQMIPGKSVYDVINQYRELVADVTDIEAGLVPIPGYMASSFTLELADHHHHHRSSFDHDVYRKRPKISDQERKKGVPWTEEEHRRFLLGLEKHGKGDWRNISRNFVISKTPTQVASHAQKYYLRQVSAGKDKRRPSIHDITTLHLNQHQHQPNHHQLHKSTTTTTAAAAAADHDHHHKNDDDNGALMVFDHSFLANYPHHIAKNITATTHCTTNILNNINIGAAAASPAGFYIKSPRFYG